MILAIMKKIFNWQVLLGILLIAASAAVYYIHFLIFRDPHHIFIYLIGDVAFVFIEVLLVTMVLHQLLHYRDRKSMLNKLNMVIGAFFSEVGTDLLKLCAAFDNTSFQVTQNLVINNDWSEKDFLKMYRNVRSYQCDIDCKKGDLEAVRNFLKEKRSFMLNLLGNPNLLEHESFTNLLWAVMHLAEELIHRKNIRNISDKDREHLAGDIKRVYHHLIVEWLNYMKHLKKSYPYLFSLAMRTNPFDKNATVEVK